MKSEINNPSESAWNTLDEQLANLNMCIVGAPRPPNRQSLIEAIAQIMDIDAEILHQHLASQLLSHFQNSTLPRRLAYIYNDKSIIDDYQKDANLATFAKITLQMVSMTYERKTLLYSIGKDQFLTAMIINEGSHSDSTALKIGKVGGNSYARIEQIIPSADLDLFLMDKKASTSKEQNISEQLYEAFKSQRFLDLGDSKISESRTPMVHSTSLIPQRVPGLRKQPSMKAEPNINLGENLSIQAEQQNEHSTSIKQQFMGQLLRIPNPIQQAEDQKLIGECNNLNINGMTNSQNNGHTQSTYLNSNVPPMINDPMYHQGQYDLMYRMYYDQQRGQQYPTNPNYQMNRSEPNISLGPSHQAPQSPMKRSPNNTAIGNTNINININNNGNQPQRNGQPSTTTGVMLPTSQKQRYTGRLKFFDQGKNYGFIIMDIDDSDIFVHFDDLHKAGIPKDRIKSYKQNEGLIRFSFKVMEYYGKYDKSRKAVDLIIEETDYNPLLSLLASNNNT